VQTLVTKRERAKSCDEARLWLGLSPLTPFCFSVAAGFLGINVVLASSDYYVICELFPDPSFLIFQGQMAQASRGSSWISPPVKPR
jgi:hypothetical protein